MNVKCWNCGQDFEVVDHGINNALRNAYDAGYRRAIEEIKRGNA